MSAPGRTPLVAAAVALGIAWALHDTSYATGLSLGPDAVGWVARAGALIGVAGGGLAFMHRTRAGLAALATGAVVVVAGSGVEWLLTAPTAPGPLPSAHEPRAVGWGLALLARVALPLAALGACFRVQRSRSRWSPTGSNLQRET